MITRNYSAEFGSGLRAEMTVSFGGGMRVLWTPDIPRNFPFKDLDARRASMESYRVWRDECFADFAKAHGMRIVVFDTPDGGSAIAFEPMQS